MTVTTVTAIVLTDHPESEYSLIYHYGGANDSNAPLMVTRNVMSPTGADVLWSGTLLILSTEDRNHLLYEDNVSVAAYIRTKLPLPVI